MTGSPLLTQQQPENQEGFSRGYRVFGRQTAWKPLLDYTKTPCVWTVVAAEEGKSSSRTKGISS